VGLPIAASFGEPRAAA